MSKEIDMKLGETRTVYVRRNVNSRVTQSQPKGILPVEAPKPDYTRRQQNGLVELFDLGTRLNQSGGITRYEELIFDALAGAEGVTPGTVNTALADSDQLAFDALALAGTPLDKTNAGGSGRPLSNCMQLPFDTDAIAVDLYIGNDVKIVAATRKEVEYFNTQTTLPVTNPDWKERVPATGDASETWQQQMIDDGEAFNTGKMGLKSTAALRIRSRLFYEQFDTADAVNFKITADATYDAPSVAFTLNKSKKYELFLKPQWVVVSPRKVWDWERLISFTTPDALPGTGNLRTSASLILGPYGSRLPVIPKPVNGIWQYREENFPGDGAALTYRARMSNITRQASSFIRYRLQGSPRTISYRYDFDNTCNATPNINGDIPQDTGLTMLQNSAYDASESIMACLRAAGFTNVTAANNGIGTLRNIDVMIIYQPISVPVGLLCGIIKQGSQTFYVWRKTSESRQASDLDSDGAFSVFFD